MEPRRSLLLQLVAIDERMVALVRRELEREGVRAEGYALLSVVGAFGPLTISQAAGMLGLPLTTASDAVARLDARGHVRRRPNPDDGRSQLLELTPDGDREWRAGWPGLRRANEAIARHLPLPAEDVRAVLEQLDAALAQALAD